MGIEGVIKRSVLRNCLVGNAFFVIEMDTITRGIGAWNLCQRLYNFDVASVC